MSENPIKRCVLTETERLYLDDIGEDEELNRYLEEVIKNVDENEKKPLITYDFFILSAISLACLGCLKYNLIDTVLLISLILLFIAFIKQRDNGSSNEQKEIDE